MKLPIRGRIALYGGGVVAVTVLVFSLVVFALYRRDLQGQQDAALNQRGAQVVRGVQARLTLHTLPPQGPFIPLDLKNSSEQFFEILDAAGTATFSTAEIDGQPPAIPADQLRQATTSQARIATISPRNGPHLRVWMQAWSRPELGLQGFVVVGQPTTAIDQDVNVLRLFLAGGALVSLLGALGLNWLVAGRALRPLETMAETAEGIGRTQDLSRRLQQDRVADEVGRLQGSFNRMLQQLEDAYHRLQGALAAQRRFVADASHELRTPLTTIRGNIGLLLAHPDVTPADRAAALHDIAGESERMSRMVQDLLTLARADAGQHLEKSPIDLQQILAEIGRQARALEPTRQIELRNGATPGAIENGTTPIVLGNPDALKQLLWILVDNAFKHTGATGHIQLGLSTANGSAVITVADDGPGIPEQDLDRIFERFYQADPARSGEGTGLGLSIARWIAQEHGGHVMAANNPAGGVTFRVELPVVKS